jgi:uncharacterized NAD(P)/FAD-binding protein YdhS
MRCPAEMAQFNAALLARRLFGKYLNVRSQHLYDRLKEIENGKYDDEMEKMKKMSEEELKEKYKERELNFKIT